MRKVLFNAFWFIPVLIFGCFNNSFTGKNDKIFLQENIRTKLDNKSLAILNKYGSTIHKYAQQYEVDWRLVMAVMKVESRFNHSAESYRGAKGFMQIMPATQSELADRMGIDSVEFEDPHGNIRGGIYYLSTLYKQYRNQGLSEENQLRFTLAAYNAGPGRIFDAQKLAEYVNDDPKEWKSIKNSLSLLSKKYSSLHRYVWEERKPTSGYFKGWKQTSNYVESVLNYYSDFKTVFKDEA
jgi:membrane-bound lytic murein transglycosylase F